VDNPVLLIALNLLWAVPAMTLLRRRAGESAPFGTALMIGGVAGLAVVMSAVALPFIERAVVPLSVRRATADPTRFATPFFGVVSVNVYVAIGVLAQVVAVAVVVARSTRLRAAAAVLTAATTAALSVVGLEVTFTVDRCIKITGTAPHGCTPPPVDAFLLNYFPMFLIEGLILAVPVVLLVSLLAASGPPDRRAGRLPGRDG